MARNPNILYRLCSSTLKLPHPSLGFSFNKSEQSPLASSASAVASRLLSSSTQPHPPQRQADYPSKEEEEEEEQRKEVSSPPSGVKDDDSDDEYEGGVHVNERTGEIGGPQGPEPTRYGDWERNGRCSDF
ncbi:uncharacterized protein LOC131145392 [Malania oleifera]|uniref:uncharacterized protein LOC131145392 n=1 Tax=Malania oleifera TaxID=397392 RepID=UPI0025AE97B0|nr:uncharacterized protein LOC131145392 [Malania oleifera]